MKKTDAPTVTAAAPAPTFWVVWRLAPDSDPEERYILTSHDGEREHPLQIKFSSGVEACNFLSNNPQYDVPKSAATHEPEDEQERRTR